MILMLSVRLAAAVHAYLDAYAPTNILIRHLRSPAGRHWSLPVSGLLATVYLVATPVFTWLSQSGDLAWVSLLAFLSAWNALKFLLTASSATLHLLCGLLRSRALSNCRSDFVDGQGEAAGARGAVGPVVSVADDRLWTEAPAACGQGRQS